MSSVAKMVYNDPSKFGLLTLDMKEKCIKAAIATVNVMAAVARKEAIKNLKSNFTLRNSFTSNQVQFTPMAQGRYSLNAIHSIVGVTEKASYMERQEEGGEHTPRSGSKLAIPTRAARGGSDAKPVQRGMRVSDVQKKSRRVHGEAKLRKARYKGKGKNVPKNKKITTYASKKAWFVARAYVAYHKKLFMAMGGKGGERNLFRITSWKAVGKGRNREVEFETEEEYNFELKKTRTKARPWFNPACEKVSKDAEKIFTSQMKKLGM
jgi:hypothetical protein